MCLAGLAFAGRAFSLPLGFFDEAPEKRRSRDRTAHTHATDVVDTHSPDSTRKNWDRFNMGTGFRPEPDLSTRRWDGFNGGTGSARNRTSPRRDHAAATQSSTKMS